MTLKGLIRIGEDRQNEGAVSRKLIVLLNKYVLLAISDEIVTLVSGGQFVSLPGDIGVSK